MKRLIYQLENLKKLGIVAIKQSLEDEGASFEEISLMIKITTKLGLKLNVKIGGCEAKNDVFFCDSIVSNGIVAPMVESEYALKKFIQTVPSTFKGDLYINLESKNAFKNLDKIITSKEFNLLKGVVIGRSDLAGSLNLTKSKVDSDKILNLLKSNLKKIKNKRKLIKMGGSITLRSKKFILELFNKGLIDRVETRNIELKLSKRSLNKFDTIIPLIFNFEKEWLEYKNKNFKLNDSSRKSILKRIVEISKRENLFI
ncbi:hypothetical protein N9V85_02400 [Candidatus Pelagibacter bacterium]|nr:hypothetical protein [Candidatus Pelagibacter bacterium]|tara:strand:+ start:21 stop:791 length:771 start_codon:yes stop_codon:yes gene_type:complete